MPSIADSIRDVASAHIRRARSAGARLVAIRAGDIVREMHLENRTPNVCSALSSRKFLEENNVQLVKREGPPSGQSTTTLFTYQLSDVGPVVKEKFYGLRGAAKELFEELGGGEEFIAAERKEFHS